MGIEREIFTSILRLTKEGPASIELIAKSSKIPLDIVKQQIEIISNSNLIEKRGNLIKVSGIQRLKMALKAINLGADIEKVCRNLSWKEFEDLAVKAFQANGYSTIKNFRFRHRNRMWEIDLLAVKGRIVVCVDCKRWMRRLVPSTIAKVVETQIERVKALSEILQESRHKLNFILEKNVYLVPMILSLIPSSHKFWNGTPIVPILQLQDFLSELLAQLQFLSFIKVELYNSLFLEYIRT
ncbi:hypothetical protein DRO54_06710 [Candidatus Bathyarchaeota archaeon]|nr:MAG: hypothetical protein DRO54_06710 [Candidatus Bathyarchaeota archaeon]